MHLVKAAAFVRRLTLNMPYKFEETFEEGCQESAVTDSLVALYGMILDGTNIRGDPEFTNPQLLMKLQRTNKIFSLILLTNTLT